MAIIGTIRKRSGLLLILIGVAIAGFVLQDALKSTKGFKYKEIGKVNKTDVTYAEFERKVEQQLENIKKQQQGKENITPQQSFQIKESTWNTMVSDILMKKEYDDLSIEVTPEEMNDMYYGKFIHSYIAQNFVNRKTGQVDRQQVRNIIDNFDKLKPEEKVQWAQLEEAIKGDRLKNKYNTLISKSYYMPTAFLKRAYNDQMSSKKCRFIAADYTTIADNTVNLTDNDYQKYYDEHKQEFDQEASRDIDYVMYEVNPSAEDMQKMTKQVNQFYEELKTTENVPDFVNSNSNDRYDSTFFKKGKLSPSIDSLMFSSAVGTVIPPNTDGKYFKMAKLIDVQFRPDSMKASHILVAYQGAFQAAQTIKRSKEQAQKIADSLRAVIQKDPVRLAEIANAISDDPSAKENKGDMKWFADQQMVAPFNDACLKGKVGDVVVVETVFGFHVINITGKTEAEKKVRVGILTYKIEPSQATYKNVFTIANKFASENTTQEMFEAAIKKQGLNKRTAEYIQQMADNIPGIEQARELVRWAYGDDAKKGDVAKQVFEFDNRMFVIAVLKEVREKGIAPLAQVKERLKNLVLREKKAEMLIAKMNTSLGQTKDLYQLATQYKTAVDTIPQINFAGSNFGRRGYEPEVIGTIATLKKGAVSKPIKGNSSIYVVIIDDEIAAPPAKDYTMVKMQMDQMYQQRVTNDVFRVLKDKAKITDNRIYFY